MIDLDVNAKPKIPELETIDLHMKSGKDSWIRKVPLLRAFAGPTAVATTPVEELNEWLPWKSQGSMLRKSERKAASGFYAPYVPSSPTSTRQADILNSTLIAAPHRGRWCLHRPGRDEPHRCELGPDYRVQLHPEAGHFHRCGGAGGCGVGEVFGC